MTNSLDSKALQNEITIVGAGLVGSLLAVRLLQLGYKVTLFEKRKDIRKHSYGSGRSINLVITSRGIQALKEAGLLRKALDLSVPVFGRMMHSKSGELTYQPYGVNQECNLSISRLALNQFLLNEAESHGAKIFFDSQIANVDFNEKFLSLEKGDKYFFSFLFATDGAGSQVRKDFIRANNEIEESVSWLPIDYKELYMPVPKPEDQLKKYQKDALHIWPRGTHMMMALANRDGSFTMTLYLPKKAEHHPHNFSAIQSESDVTTLFESEFADAKGDINNYQSDFLNNPQGALGTIRLNKWTNNQDVLLLGDAAHAIVPFFGQGTNLGFEDVSVLIKLMLENNKDLSQCFRDFERVQKQNADAIADMAIENWYEMSERVADPRFLLRKKIESELEIRHPHIFKSRYGLVTYTLTSYSSIQKIGQEQDRMFNDLLKELNSPNDFEKFNWTKAEEVLNSTYLTFSKNHNVSLNRVSI